VPELTPPNGSPEDDRPGGLVGLLNSGVEAIVAMLGRLLAGIVGAIFGNLTGAAPPKEDDPTTPGTDD